MTKKKASVKIILSRTAPPPPTGHAPDSQSVMRGREFATKMVSEFGTDELADALRGFRQGILGHLKEHQAKIDAVCQHIINAEEAINP